jgi:hypothetical protein
MHDDIRWPRSGHVGDAAQASPERALQGWQQPGLEQRCDRIAEPLAKAEVPHPPARIRGSPGLGNRCRGGSGQASHGVCLEQEQFAIAQRLLDT